MYKNFRIFSFYFIFYINTIIYGRLILISNSKCSQYFNLTGIYNDPLRIYYCILIFLPSPRLSILFTIRTINDFSNTRYYSLYFSHCIEFQQSTFPSFIIFLLTFHNMLLKLFASNLTNFLLTKRIA